MDAKKRLEELFVFNKAMMIGEEIWKEVETWNYFQKDTIGKQWVRSTDSIAANIAEGYGRYYFKENKLFCFYGRGSLMEAKTWLIKASNRNLITPEKFEFLLNELEFENSILNKYINSIGK